jgi:DNA mismatch endonuclease (patch repair protein)
MILKYGGNVERDKRNIAELEKQGWKVIVIWQCEIRNASLREEYLPTLITKL